MQQHAGTSAAVSRFFFKKNRLRKEAFFFSSQPSSEIVSRMLALYGIAIYTKYSNFVGLDIPDIKEHMIQTINAKCSKGV